MAGYFLLLVPQEVTKEEDAPATRSPVSLVHASRLFSMTFRDGGNALGL